MRHDDGEDDDAMPGQDSFIDVICNMVGILITLVVVVGVRVSQLVIDPADEAASVVAVQEEPVEGIELEAEVAEVRAAYLAAADECIALQGKVILAALNAATVERRRDELSLVRAEIERSIEERRDQLDAAAQEAFDAQREITEAQIRLQQLTEEQLSLLNAPTDVEEIETVPTPLAKTVTGDEIHVRLRRGELAVVPVDQLLDEVERRGPEYLRGGLQRRDEATDVYGPINGFRLRLSAERFAEAPVAPGALRRVGTELRGVFLPTSLDLGVPVEQALLPDSELSAALRSRKSAVGAVTVWVYPDSYAELRLLKKAMWDAGVPLAVRPLNNDQPITFSTRGTKSSAQ